MRSITLTIIFLSFLALCPRQSRAQGYASMQGDTLRMGNSSIERVFLWNGGELKTVALVDKLNGNVMRSKGSQPDFLVLKGKAEDGRWTKENVPSDGVHPAYLQVTVDYRKGNLEIKRQYRIYDVAAIACHTWLRGHLGAIEQGREVSGADRKNIEFKEDMDAGVKIPVLDRLELQGNHWRCRAVEFYDYTDWNDNLVAERSFIPYRENGYRGNLLLASDLVTGHGFFFLKEAPCSSTQLSYPGYDFRAEYGNFKVTGLGVRSGDVTPDGWTAVYGVVVGVFGGGEREALAALHDYQRQARLEKAAGRDGDEMVMLNTWGDRSQDARINADFCLAELDRAARLGVTVFQLDDGWQIGKSPNSKVAKGSFKDIWSNKDYWKPDPVKFPDGLKPIVDKGKRLGIRIGLWYNPSVQHDFADWRKDADAILGLWREYGITIFKIDGLQIPTKAAEQNLRSLFDTVQKESGGQVIFNLDATAGRRGGYNMFTEYGNIFMENRYTDWGNYYPFHTLRNLWQLSRYVPAQRLQVEFLNKWRNADKYAEGDIFAPGNYSFDYLFATTMAGQPLAWMEASNLPEEAFATGRLIKQYTKIQEDLHSGTILPIGEEPSGRSWTGFQSIKDSRSGYFIVYRENTDDASARVKTWLDGGAKVTLTPVLGDGEAATLQADEAGRVSFTLAGKNSFAVYKYEIIE